MKKFRLLFLTVALILISLIGCSKQNTIEKTLEKVNVIVDKVYFVDNFENITIAFYKEKSSGHQTVGVFNKEKEKLNFIAQQDLLSNLSIDDDITFSAFMHEKTEDMPEYSLQFGIINNPQIEKINLHMIGEPYLDDRYAEVIQLDDLKIWYTFLDINRIFNIRQGLSKDGKVIYSNSRIYD